MPAPYRFMAHKRTILSIRLRHSEYKGIAAILGGSYFFGITLLTECLQEFFLAQRLVPAQQFEQGIV